VANRGQIVKVLKAQSLLSQGAGPHQHKEKMIASDWRFDPGQGRSLLSTPGAQRHPSLLVRRPFPVVGALIDSLCASHLLRVTNAVTLRLGRPFWHWVGGVPCLTLNPPMLSWRCPSYFPVLTNFQARGTGHLDRFLCSGS
jgi:hypothetical protein